jgi:hypothetical protein
MAGDDAEIEGISLERYAEIAAHLAVDSGRPRAEVLGELELEEGRWAAAHAGFSQRIQDEVVRGSAPGLGPGVEARYPLAQRYAVAFAAAAKRVRERAAAPAPAPAAEGPPPEPPPPADPRSALGASNAAARAALPPEGGEGTGRP